MNNANKLFLTIFRDLKIEVDEHNSSEKNTAYDCYLNGQLVRYTKVISLIKQYQDEVIKILLDESQEG